MLITQQEYDQMKARIAELEAAQRRFVAEFYSGRVKVERATPEFWESLNALVEVK